MAKPVVKEFNVFCHFSDTNEPIYHKVTIDKKGSVKLHGHPELQSEVYYHLLMVQKEKAESAKRQYYYGGYPYEVSGCLQFYFSLIHKKFEKHLDRIKFVHKHEDTFELARGDNQRLDDYLEKIRLKTRDRQRFDRAMYWSEEACYRQNMNDRNNRLRRRFTDEFYSGIEKFPRYVVSLDYFLLDNIRSKFKDAPEDAKYHFTSSISSRCSTSSRTWGFNDGKRDGYMQVTIAVTKDWYSEVKRKGIACIETEKHGKFFVLSAKAHKNGYIVDGVVQSSGTKKRYIIQTFYIERNVVTGAWEATRKNNVHPKKELKKHDISG